MTDNIRQRPGDQPLPTPTDGPSMHDLVIRDLRGLAAYVPSHVLPFRHSWYSGTCHDAIDDMAGRRALGLQRYGSLLQAGNGRDVLRDLYEEVQDAAVYARQAIEEGIPLYDVYDQLLQMLPRVRAVIQVGIDARARQAETAVPE